VKVLSGALIVAALVISGCATVPFKGPTDPVWGYSGEVQSGNFAGLKLVAIWPSRATCIQRRDLGQNKPDLGWLIEDDCHRLMVTEVGYGEYWAFTFSGPPAGILAIRYLRNDDEIKGACSRLRGSVSGRTSECSRISVKYLE
jgi:hypothetical protein